MKQEITDVLLKVAEALWLDLLSEGRLNFSVTIKGKTAGSDSQEFARELACSLESKMPYLHSRSRHSNGPHYEITFPFVLPWDRMRIKRYARRNIPEAHVEIEQMPYCGCGPP